MQFFFSFLDLTLQRSVKQYQRRAGDKVNTLKNIENSVKVFVRLVLKI